MAIKKIIQYPEVRKEIIIFNHLDLQKTFLFLQKHKKDTCLRIQKHFIQIFLN